VLNREPENDAGSKSSRKTDGLPCTCPAQAIYKVYAESFKGEDHLRDILREAQIIVDAVLAADTPISKPA
jgi:phosphoglucomutase